MCYDFKTYAFVSRNQIVGLMNWCVNVERYERYTLSWLNLIENAVFYKNILCLNNLIDINKYFFFKRSIILITQHYTIKNK